MSVDHDLDHTRAPRSLPTKTTGQTGKKGDTGPMSNESRASIISVHASLGMNAPSHYALQHMAYSMDGDGLTEDCLRASLVRSDAYRLSVRTRYRDVCYALLGDDDDTAFRVFDSAQSTRDGELVEVSDSAIHTSVRQSTRFEMRYTDLVRRSFSTLRNGEQPSESFTTAMVSRFRDDPSFLLDDLHTIVRAMPLYPSPSFTPSASPSTSPPLSPSGSFDDLSRAASLVGARPATVLCMLQSSACMLQSEAVRLVTLAGDSVFGRPWYAAELVAYVSECVPITDPVALHQHVGCLLGEHSAAWEIARGVHAHLLGDVLEEVDFVRRYVNAGPGPGHRDPGFSAVLSLDILASPLYQDRIRRRLVVVQKRLYDMALREDELKRLALQAMSSGVGVGDDEVSAMLHVYRRECDALVSVVVGVYVVVLSREPDQNELLAEVEGFRSRPMEQARTELAVRLSKGFEFHDVVKTRLRSAYHACSGVHVPMQTLYAMLERVLLGSESALRSISVDENLAALVDGEVRRNATAQVSPNT